jgi:hypothetical protein
MLQFLMTFGFTFLFLGFIYPVLEKLGLGKYQVIFV